MWDIWKIQASVHEPRGIWCACGELVKDCFVLALLLPARDKMKQAMYEQIFADKED